ncbi:MAG TPA: ABC transporter ATP-binding protein [Candidatus Pullichristensenella excrementigallinarum]|uniref:ABC transporter ATP-binding protein n=1 Tax=Candidatus Pullichristensenella excrementigallinarum TaxID=2840907 RepID=A0A9D1IBC2_9FIRM|nr:ABC transporter ATP-binding protein [Candidatus Pullichristensenella excrementigallinarum]
MLTIENLCAFYGKIQALHNVNIEVGDHEIVALVGSNGAGKTTILNSISGYTTTTGSVRYNGEEISKKKSHRISRMGILHVPEGRHVFPGLTVEQNLTVGTVAWGGVRLSKGNLQEDLRNVYNIFPRLEERKKQLAWSLSGGEQQMLALGRALMGRPKLLLLDEPSMGLAPIIIDEVFVKIKEINQRLGTPVLLVEQNARRALKASDRAYVIERGKITLSGPSADLLRDERVREAYLGKRKTNSPQEKGAV